ncbi:MAG: alpha/beta hydrolase [Planctomycetota bacterium]
MSIVSVLAVGCGQRSAPPPETQSAAPEHGSPLRVESGDSPSEVDPPPPFDPPPSAIPPFTPSPFPPRPFAASPFTPSPSTEPDAAIEPQAEPPAAVPLAGDTAPPPGPTNPLGLEATGPANQVAKPLTGEPDSGLDELRGPVEANAPQELAENFRGNPLRGDATTGAAKVRVNPLRAGVASFAPTRPRIPRASLSDTPSADAGGGQLTTEEGKQAAERNRFRPSPAPPFPSPRPTADRPAADRPTAESTADAPPAGELPTADPPTELPSRLMPPRATFPTAEPPTAELPTTEPPTAELPTAELPTAEPAGELPSNFLPPGAEPSGAEPPGAEPSGAEPSGAEPSGAEPSAMVPTADEPRGIDSANSRHGGGPAVKANSGDFTTVRVFYATDRARLDAFDLTRLSWQPLPWLPVVALGAVALALLTGSMFRRASGRAWVAGIAAALSAVLVLAAGGPLYLGQVKISQVVERLTGSSRLPQPNSTPSSDTPADARLEGRESLAAADVYGNGRGDLEYGECEVTIPRRHEPGMIERPSLWRLEFHESLDRHVVLRTVERRGEDAFFAAVRGRVATSPRSDLFVFIHGYNVSFDMAARRTAQMAHDLKFDGAPIFYSWPSQGGLLKYPVDETNVAWTVPHLKQFLRQLAARSEARAINVIAHSMGNRALASAVRELSLEQPAQQKRFQQIVLAAPDIDAEVFKRDVAPLLASSAEHVTLYASSRDQALAASKLVHGYPRAGDSGSNLLVIPGIDTVDVTEVDTGILGHSYYGNSVPILRDLEQILHGGLTPEKRPWLQTAQRDGQSYWMFNDQSIAILRGARHR